MLHIKQGDGLGSDSKKGRAWSCIKVILLSYAGANIFAMDRLLENSTVFSQNSELRFLDLEPSLNLI